MFLPSPTVCDETGRGAGGWKNRRLVPHGVLPPALCATPLSEGGLSAGRAGQFHHTWSESEILLEFHTLRPCVIFGVFDFADVSWKCDYLLTVTQSGARSNKSRSRIV